MLLLLYWKLIVGGGMLPTVGEHSKDRIPIFISQGFNVTLQDNEYPFL